MSESTPKAVVPPRWIVHSDGRVSEFEPSQLAADLYRARCSHRREGAALFAAELSTAVMHFAGREFASPVWRADRLKNLTADLLRELGHGDTADAWLQQTADDELDGKSIAYSPDLVGLVEEGVLDFDLRLEDARASLGVVDAVDHAGRAGNANEFVLGIPPILVEAANNAERILLRGAGLGAALLHQPGETPESVAALLVELVSRTMATTLTPIAIDLRSMEASNAIERLSGGPLFPVCIPSDWRMFHQSLIDAMSQQVASLERLRIPLCIQTSISREAAKHWLGQWTSQGGDRAASLLFDVTGDSDEMTRAAEIVFRIPPASRPTNRVSQELGILSAVIRAAAQRAAALRRRGAIGTDDPMMATVFLSGVNAPDVVDESRKRLSEIAKAYGMVVKFAAPCRVWWSEDVGDFCSHHSDFLDANLDIWNVPSDAAGLGRFLIPRRDST